MDRIWYKDPQHLFARHNYDKIVPSSSMTFAEQMNSLMRLSVYFSVLVFIFKRNANIFLVPVFVGLVTFLLYISDTQRRAKDKFELASKNQMINRKDGSVCKAPSKENPFMNVLISEYSSEPERPKACDITDRYVSKQVKDNFDSDLYRDVDDIFHKKASDRQFYTTPATTIPNDAVSFAKWCYGGVNQTCKEGNGDRCFSNTYRYVKN